MSEALQELVEQEQPVTPAQTEDQKEDQPEIEVINEEQKAETAPEQKKAFDPKTDKVEFNTPEQQEKFNYMYKQTKMSDSRNQMLTDLLQKQQAQLDALNGRFQQTDSADAERMLLGKIKAARDSGDDAAEISAIGEMVDFKADKKFSERVNTQKQAPYQQEQEAPDVRYVREFIEAADETGQQVRPWMNNNHPDQAVALQALENIKGKYIGDPYALPKTLTDLDNFMRLKMTKQAPPSQAQMRGPNPLQGSNLTNVKQKTTIRMTRAEIDIAKKLGVDPKSYAVERDTRTGKK